MGLDLNTRPDVLFTIEWAKISLYQILPDSATRAQPWGKPDPSRQIFNGLEAENIRVREGFEVSERRPSGWKFPIPRHLSRQHSISIEKVWVTKPTEEDNPELPDDYKIVPNRLMCMFIAWVEPVNGKAEEDLRWKSRTYYGVTGPQYDLSGSTEIVSFTGDQSFSAMFYKAKTGKGPDPQIET